MGLSGGADHAKQLDGILVDFEHLGTDPDRGPLVKKSQRVAHQYLVQILIQEYFAEPDVFGDYQEKLRNFLSEFHMQVFRLVNCDHALHVFLLHQIHDLATVRHHFQRLASHHNFLIIEHLPVLEPRHDPRKNLVKVLVHRRMLITELFRLIEQILAQ